MSRSLRDRSTSISSRRHPPSDQRQRPVAWLLCLPVGCAYRAGAAGRYHPRLRGNHATRYRQVLTLNQTHIFEPRTLCNEARIGFNRIGIVFNAEHAARPAVLRHLDTQPQPLGQHRSAADHALRARSHLRRPRRAFLQGRTDTLGVVSNATTLLKGKHSVKFGGEFRRHLSANFTGDNGNAHLRQHGK